MPKWYEVSIDDEEKIIEEKRKLWFPQMEKGDWENLNSLFDKLNWRQGNTQMHLVDAIKILGFSGKKQFFDLMQKLSPQIINKYENGATVFLSFGLPFKPIIEKSLTDIRSSRQMFPYLEKIILEQTKLQEPGKGISIQEQVLQEKIRQIISEEVEKEGVIEIPKIDSLLITQLAHVYGQEFPRTFTINHNQIYRFSDSDAWYHNFFETYYSQLENQVHLQNKDSKTKTDKKNQPTSPEEYKKYFVLYVDDEEKSLKYFREIFKEKFSILTATNSEDGFELLKTNKEKIAILMTDQRLPGEKGIKFLEKSRELEPRIVRILCTAYSDLETTIDSVNKGSIYKYVTKPWDIPQLEIILKQGMDLFLKEITNSFEEQELNGNVDPIDKQEEVKLKKETVPYHSDEPTFEDQLQRKALAEVLVYRIKEIREKNKTQNRGSFLVHLGGSWGSGKSTFVNFLREIMEKYTNGESWITVYFSAWQHQRLNPPWWFLMDSVFKTSLREKLKEIDKNVCSRYLGWLKLWFDEYRWRFSLNIGLAFGVFILYMVLVCLIISLINISFKSEIESVWDVFFKSEDKLAENILKFVTLVTTLGGLFIFWAKLLTPNSAKAARKFVETTSDPLKELKEHYRNMIKSIGRPVCVFIDDLDRCQGGYIVDLLEGIQTLFREGNVTYIAIADRNWLCASFSNIYRDYASVADEPGKPMGFYFMDKIFQLSFSLPPIDGVTKKNYWKYLINQNMKLLDIDKHQESLERYEKMAEKNFENIENEDDIGKELEVRVHEIEDKSDENSEALIQAYRRAAVLRFNKPDSIMRTTHTLEEFAPLLESNPRAMKRFINEYSMEWTLDKLRGGNIPREKLARWTILKLRWPLLAEHLLNFPDNFRIIGGSNVESEKNDYLISLLKSSAVRNVINGGGLGGELDELTIKKIAGAGA